MTSSRSLLNRFSVAENEYYAEEVIVTIVPNIDHPVFRFLSGTFGPLFSGMPCEMPLWLAIYLRKRGKCIIKMPSWLKVSNLEQYVQHERNQRTLGDLPFHYIEIANLLLKHAKDDIANPELVSSLLQDIENIRMDRIRLGIGSVAETVNKDEPVVSAALNHVSSLEITAIREFFLQSMDAFLWLKPPEESADGGAGQQQGAGRYSRDEGLGGAGESNDNNNATGTTTTKKLRRFRKD